MKILLIGFGSIGQRHYENLRKLGYKDIAVYDPNNARFKEHQDFKRFEAVFVCNPTHMHAATALKAARAGCNLFIEKPLSHSSSGLQEVLAEAKKRKLVTFVACNLRFHPAIKKVKSLLERKFLGKVYAIYLEYGRYLPYQRPFVDYQKTYAARKSMGGGILLDDVHDFDLLFWLNNFEGVRKSDILCAKASNLDIDVEDICNAHFLFRNNVVGNIRCDYLQQHKKRSLKIIGEKGNLEWNFRENIVWFEYARNGQEKKRRLFTGSKEDEEIMYRYELKYFLSCARSKKQTFNTLETAYKTLLQMKR
ncbi:MAG: Gfo/Idh/MocA family oxidoreductase [Candidatus Wildermuthbacteria bacterium]|nr:Gfo/Idh/MocA family oxidoreductase [Candidatus Wildermuthbacteria bacterium]